MENTMKIILEVLPYETLKILLLVESFSLTFSSLHLFFPKLYKK